MDVIRVIIAFEIALKRATLQVDISVSQIEKLIGNAHGDICAPIILQSRRIANLAVQRQIRCVVFGIIDRISVIGKTNRKQPEISNPILSSKSKMPGIVPVAVLCKFRCDCRPS